MYCCRKTIPQTCSKEKHKKKQWRSYPILYQESPSAIVSREMFQLAQEELARRNSKKPVTQKKAKTNRGRLTSKYPLSERLFCGNCGCYYRRITWDIHGRKQVVWRCINRVEFGKRYCGDSPSIPEEVLHHAILEAIRSLVQNRQKDWQPIWKTLCWIVSPIIWMNFPPEAIKNKLKNWNRNLTNYWLWPRRKWNCRPKARADRKGNAETERKGSGIGRFRIYFTTHTRSGGVKLRSSFPWPFGTDMGGEVMILYDPEIILRIRPTWHDLYRPIRCRGTGPRQRLI